MKFIRSLADRLNEVKGAVQSTVATFTNQEFLDRAMAIGFVVGGADGDFDGDERAALVSLVKTHPVLSAYNEDQIMASFNKIEGLYKITIPMGNRKALELLGENTDAAQAKALMEFGAVLSTVDGSVDDVEVEALTKIGSALNESIDDYRDLLVV